MYPIFRFPSQTNASFPVSGLFAISLYYYVTRFTISPMS